MYSMNSMWRTCLTLVLLLLAAPLSALEIAKVSDNVYALVGELGQRSSSNLGNNATFGVVVTSAGVVLIDSGASWKGAEHIEKAISEITAKPVVLVINSGGQDHRWLGNGYFRAKGARILTSSAAFDDQHKRTQEQLSGLMLTVGEAGMEGTRPCYAEMRYDNAFSITVGDTTLQLQRIGPAHTAGDSYVWLPQQRVVFTGDVVYTERLLGVLPFSSSKNWIEAFKSVEALEPAAIVPGHGHPATLAQARADTYDYLLMLRAKVSELIALGGGMERVGEIDQSAFSRLQGYNDLKGRNAQQVYSQLEWE